MRTRRGELTLTLTLTLTPTLTLTLIRANPKPKPKPNPNHSLVLSRAFDEPNVTYEGSLTDLGALQRFVAAESLPLVMAFSSATQQQIFSAAQPLQALTRTLTLTPALTLTLTLTPTLTLTLTLTPTLTF